MKPDTPMLMITLQIPLAGEFSAEDVLEAINDQLTAALEAIRQGQFDESEAPDEEEAEAAVEDTEAEEASSPEVLEPFTDDTRQDLLAALGYSADE